jgi:hypothetical protein
LFQWPSLFARISQRANLSEGSVRHASKYFEACSNNRPCVTYCCVRTALVGLYFSYLLTCYLQECSTSVTNVVTPVLFGTDYLWYRVIRSMPRTFRLVRTFGPNSDLFTASPFPSSAAGGMRLCGTTHWAVEVYDVRRGPMVEEPPAEFMAGKPFRR